MATVRNPGAAANAKLADEGRAAIGTGIGTNPVSEAHTTELYGQQANGISNGAPNAASHMTGIYGTNVGNRRNYDGTDVVNAAPEADPDDDGDPDA
jgi:hypothetical protein